MPCAERALHHPPLSSCPNRGLHLTLALAVGIPGVLLFAVGMPLLSAWWLGRNRHRLDQPDFEALYGTLYEEYEVGAGTLPYVLSSLSCIQPPGTLLSGLWAPLTRCDAV